MRTPALVTCLLLAFLGRTCFSQVKGALDSVDQVDQRIGTSGFGQTYPAAGVPFGMTQWAPQTQEGEKKCVPPYYDEDKRIQGIRGTHFMSGSCTKDYGSVTLMAESGPLKLGERERASAFSHEDEKLSPYLYAVRLADYGIQAEATGTSRAGILFFRFSRPGRSWLLVQSNAGPGEGEVRIDPEHAEITGDNPVRRLYAGSGKPAGFKGYFVVQFSRPFKVGGTWSGAEQHPGAYEQVGRAAGAPGAYVSFDLKPGETIKVRVGTSFTSLDEARKNLAEEIPDWDFERVAVQARQKWRQALSQIQVTSQSAKAKIFYTSLYHAWLLPRMFSDADGTYASFAGGTRIEHAKGFTYYDDYSLWDTFRAVHPLLTILEPDRELEMIKSLLAKGEQGEYLPIYPAWNSFTSEMIGDHASTLFVDAYEKGIRGFDVAKAYELMRHNAMDIPSQELYEDGRGRRGLASYLKYGYIPLEDPVPSAFHKAEQVSRTLEYAYDDSMLAILAQELGKAEDGRLFAKRARNYRNIIDPSTGFARGRHADGSWVTPFEPGKTASYITEGLPFQYTFFAPQDIPGLIEAVGGREAFIRKLDELFAKGYYWHGNEPSHHIAYLYDDVGEAWKTQQHVREVMEKEYRDAPAGIAGNDDCGQISAWFLFSALGFYPVSPGTPRYWIGSPYFDDMTVHLPSGKKLHIFAGGAEAGKQYIRSVTLNGTPINRIWLTHSEVIGGGELVFEMSATPTGWPDKP